MTETVTVNGVPLFTRSAGLGPPDIVVLHGGPGAGISSLIPALDSLAIARRLRYYDQRGCGGSHVSPGTPVGWQQHVDDLSALVDYWQIDRATIIGHSWGALLCLLFASRNPGRIRRMLLVTPAAATSEDRDCYLEELNRRSSDLEILKKQRELLRSGLRTSDPTEFRKRAFKLTLEPYLKDPKRTIGVEPFQISHRARATLWRSLGKYDLSKELSDLSIPALVIHGAHDPIPLASSKRIADLLGARLEVFENSGHMPFFEERARFLEVSEGFLQDTGI